MSKFFDWIGIKIYNNSDSFKDIIYGIYYRTTLQPELQKVENLTNENILLKTRLAALEKLQEKIVETPNTEDKPKKRIRHKKL